jgi:cysteine desulfurase
MAEGLTASIEDVGESARPVGVGGVGDGPMVARAKIASSCHLRVGGVDQEELLMLLDDEGVCASAGAACASGGIEPSHVLLAMGWSPAEARSALRLSLGYTTTDREIDHVLDVMPKVVERLRA